MQWCPRWPEKRTHFYAPPGVASPRFLTEFTKLSFAHTLKGYELSDPNIYIRILLNKGIGLGRGGYRKVEYI